MKTARRSLPPARSCCASRAPASKESAALDTAVKARRNCVRSKRAIATLTVASWTCVPAISPEVEHPTSTECGNAAASSLNGVGSTPNSGAANASTKVWPLSRSAGSGESQPSAVR
jgi:hypothetical protein